MSKRKKREYAVDVLKREIEARKTKLKRCPFCNGEAVVLQHKDGVDDWIILCKKCGCQTDFMFTEYEAIHAWNTRVDEECFKEPCNESPKDLPITRKG